MKLRAYLFLIAAFCFVVTAFSQQPAATQPITGTVTGPNGAPIANVSVTITGISTGTLTDARGNFTLHAAPGQTIVFSSVEFEKKEVRLTVANIKNPLRVSMLQKVSSMNDVVVVGVQSQSRRNSTSAISTVYAKDIENFPAPSVDQLLQGRIAGMNVQITSGEPGVAPTVVVRGNTRVNTNIGYLNVAQAQALTGPLYVIDGVPVNPDDISSSIDATGTNYLAGINVNDIESVDVQKDAAATAAWGSRGANGVVYIKTRKGNTGAPQFRVNVYGGITQQPKLLPTLTGSAERDQKMALINTYATPANLATLPQLLTDQFNPYFNNATDWQGLFYRSGSVQNVDATISGAGKGLNYRISTNYYNEKGIIEAFGYTRYSLRGNFNFDISSKLSGQFIVSFSKGDRQRGKKYYANSDDNTPVSGAAQPSSFFQVTPFDASNFNGTYNKLRNKNVNDLYGASLTLDYKILPWLRYSFLGSANVTSISRDYFSPSNIDSAAFRDPNAPQQPSSAESDKGTFATYYLSNALNFNKTLQTSGHIHQFALTASQQFNSDIVNSNYVGGTNLPSNDIQIVSGVPQANLYGGSSYSADGLLSFTGQLQYTLDNRYLLYGSYRGDASSRFGADSKWGYFPAAGIGWIISEEPFMQNLKNIVPYLKIRASYGVSGTQSGDFYAPFNAYTIPGTYNGSTAVQPSYTNGLTKDNLTWARTIQKDLGMDVQLFNNRATLTVDVYEKLSKDDYYNFQLPFYTGFQSVNFNAHDLWVSNQGMDLTINTKNLPPSSPLQWNMQVTLSYNKNLIARLPNNNRSFMINDGYELARIFSVGQPIYEMFQMKYLGVYNRQSDIPFDPITGKGLTYFHGGHPVVPGDPKWLDADHSGDVWESNSNGDAAGDRVPTGDPNPKFTGGWVNDFTYKHFSLSILGVFTWKRTIVNTLLQSQISSINGGLGDIYTFASGRIPDLSGLNYWTPQRASSKQNYSADFPALNPFGQNFYQYRLIASTFNTDGSYFKIKAVTLGYQVPRNIIQRMKLNDVRIYAIADNLYTFKHNGIGDPEIVDQLGVYSGALYPTPIKITLGVDIKF